MGSFGAVCFATNQMISDDDEVVLFPILRQNSYRPVEFHFPDRRKKSADKNPETISKHSYCTSKCYVDCFWGIAGPVIYGKYADYGRIALTNSLENIKVVRVLLDHMHMNASVVHASNNKDTRSENAFDISTKYHPHTEYSFEELEDIWEYMWEAVMRENRVFLRDYQGNPEPMSFAMMHKAAADHLIKMVEEDTGYRGKSYNQVERLTKYLNTSEVVSLIVEDSFEDSQGMKHIMGISRLFSLEDINIGSGDGSRFLNQYYHVGFDEGQQFFRGKSYPFTQDAIIEFKKIVQPLLDAKYILSGMESLSLKLSPAVFGHQDYHNESGADYRKLVVNVNNTIKADRKKRYGEDDDEDLIEDEDDMLNLINQEIPEDQKEHLEHMIDVLYDATKTF